MSLTAVALVLVSGLAWSGMAAADTAAPTAPSPFRAEFLAQLDDVEKKLVALAEAIPQEKYSWRPGEGVRSTSEVFLHIAGGNYFLPTFIGLQPPVSWTAEMEKETEKAKVIASLKESLAYVRQVANELPEAELGRAVTFFGRDSTVLGILFLAANHLHEHLGQAIAYARTNGIVPPWSAGAGGG
jgi:uncharacterized damage-inducible protein DinB